MGPESGDSEYLEGQTVETEVLGDSILGVVECLDAFLTGLASKTAIAYLADFRHFSEYVGFECVEEALSLLILRDAAAANALLHGYLVHMTSGKLARRTINRRLSALNSFLKFACERWANAALIDVGALRNDVFGLDQSRPHPFEFGQFDWNVDVSKSAISSRFKKIYGSRTSWRCEVCGWAPPRYGTDYYKVMEVHHAMPKNAGGKDEPGNLILLCPNCHRIAHRITSSLLRIDRDAILTRQQVVSRTREVLGISGRISVATKEGIESNPRLPFDRI